MRSTTRTGVTKLGILSFILVALFSLNISNCNEDNEDVAPPTYTVTLPYFDGIMEGSSVYVYGKDDVIGKIVEVKHVKRKDLFETTIEIAADYARLITEGSDVVVKGKVTKEVCDVRLSVLPGPADETNLIASGSEFSSYSNAVEYNYSEPLPESLASRWVLRINREHVLTAREFRDEFFLQAKASGWAADKIGQFFKNTEAKTDFLRRMINNELLYVDALELEIDERDDFKSAYEEEKAVKIAEDYMRSLVDIRDIVVTEKEKRDLFEESLTKMSSNTTLEYNEQTEEQLEARIRNQKYAELLQKIVASEITDHSIVTNTEDDEYILVIDGTYKIPTSRYNKKYEEMEKMGVINDANKAQIREHLLKELVSERIMIIKAKEAGYFNTDEAEVIGRVVYKQVLIQKYIEVTIKDKIERKYPVTDSDIEAAYMKYNSVYGFDTMKTEAADNVLYQIALNEKMQREMQYRNEELLGNNRIEKNVHNIR